MNEPKNNAKPYTQHRTQNPALRTHALALALSAITALPAIGATPQKGKVAPNAPTGDYDTPLSIGKATFQAEIANTPARMQRGMMFRTDMRNDQAMLFLFGAPKQAKFWMKNTLIPLDMLFFDASGILREIKANVPPCQTPECPIYASENRDILYVVELNGGAAKQHKIKIGDKLRAH